MARLPDPTGSLDDEGRRVWNRLRERRAARGAALPAPYVPLMHNPALAEHFEQFGDHVRFAGVLPRDVYEFAALATAHHIGARYEWDHHEPYARAAGVPDTAIAALVSGVEPPPPYAALLGAVDVFLAHRRLPEPLQEQVRDLIGMDGLVELAVVVGLYAMMGAVINGFDIVPEDDV